MSMNETFIAGLFMLGFFIAGFILGCVTKEEEFERIKELANIELVEHYTITDGVRSNWVTIVNLNK